jgi:hypothetical protein
MTQPPSAVQACTALVVGAAGGIGRALLAGEEIEDDSPVVAVSSPETDNRASKSNLGIILLSVLGGLLVIVLLTILIISRVKKNRIS